MEKWNVYFNPITKNIFASVTKNPTPANCLILHRGLTWEQAVIAIHAAEQLRVYFQPV